MTKNEDAGDRGGRRGRRPASEPARTEAAMSLPVRSWPRPLPRPTLARPIVQDAEAEPEYHPRREEGPEPGGERLAQHRERQQHGAHQQQVDVCRAGLQQPHRDCCPEHGKRRRREQHAGLDAVEPETVPDLGQDGNDRSVAEACREGESDHRDQATVDGASRGGSRCMPFRIGTTDR